LLCVWRLSNLLRSSDQPSREPVRFGPCPADKRWAALALALSHNGALADDRQVEQFLAFLRTRGKNLDDLWIAEQGDELAWALLPIVSPGRTMLLL
jgi:hypothetical protein